MSIIELGMSIIESFPGIIEIFLSIGAQHNLANLEQNPPRPIARSLYRSKSPNFKTTVYLAHCG